MSFKIDRVGAPDWLSAESRNGILIRLVVLFVLGVAAWSRLLGYDSVPLWLDEAWRANLTVDAGWLRNLLDGSDEGAITSFTYALFVHGLSSIYDVEWVLRLSSLLPGVLSVLLVIPIVSIVTRSSLLGCFAGLSIALNPTMITYSKELKPYALELCVQLFLVLVALHYIECLRADRRSGLNHHALLFILGPLATLTAANSVFILPGWYVSIIYWEYKSLRRIPWLMLMSGILTAALLWASYKYIWSSASGDQSLHQYWSDGFYGGSQSYLGWLLYRVGTILHAAMETTVFAAAATVAGSIKGIVVAHVLVVGILAMVGIFATLSLKRPERFFLLVSPIISTYIANVVGIWPLGAFRINLFAYSYVVVLFFVGCGWIALWERSIRYAVIVGLLAYFGIVPFLDNSERFAALHPPDEDLPAALKALSDNLASSCGDKPLVLVNSSASHAFLYYTKYQATYSKLFAHRLLNCARFEGTIEAYIEPARYQKQLDERFADSTSIWFLYSHLSDSEKSVLIDAVSKFGKVENVSEQTGAGSFQVITAR